MTIPGNKELTSSAKSTFGFMPDGQEVHEYILTNENDVSVSILSYGGIIRSIKTPDRSGEFADIVLGYDDLAGYLADSAYMGAIIGRFANRIADASFNLEGKTYSLNKNEGSNTLHGGEHGFNRALWSTSILNQEAIPSLQLRHVSKDGDQGFPGELRITVTYVLNDRDELSVEFQTTSTRKTLVSLTLHPYFNLGSLPQDTVDKHLLKIKARKYLPVNGGMIPTGEQRDVHNSPFDFLSPVPIGARIDNTDDQLEIAGGYDHCFVIDKTDQEETDMATLYDPESGRILTLRSNAPGLHLYTANFLSGEVIGKNNIPFRSRQAVCLEPQQFPNAPNEPSFPSAILEPGGLYNHRIVYRFEVAN